MKSVERIRKEAMALSAGERAGLVHDLILSLEDPDAYELNLDLEAEIERRARKVKKGKATGRPAQNVLGEIEDKLKGVIKAAKGKSRRKVSEHPFFNMYKNGRSVEQMMDRLRG